MLCPAQSIANSDKYVSHFSVKEKIKKLIVETQD